MGRSMGTINGTVRDMCSGRDTREGVDNSTSSNNDIVQTEVAISFNTETPNMRLVDTTSIVKIQEIILSQFRLRINEHILAYFCAKQTVIDSRQIWVEREDTFSRGPEKPLNKS